jgi:hypothetical protein
MSILARGRHPAGRGSSWSTSPAASTGRRRQGLGRCRSDVYEPFAHTRVCGRRGAAAGLCDLGALLPSTVAACVMDTAVCAATVALRGIGRRSLQAHGAAVRQHTLDGGSQFAAMSGIVFGDVEGIHRRVDLSSGGE